MLPPELIYNILSFIPNNKICYLININKKWNEIIYFYVDTIFSLKYKSLNDLLNDKFYIPYIIRYNKFYIELSRVYSNNFYKTKKEAITTINKCLLNDIFLKLLNMILPVILFIYYVTVEQLIIILD